MSEFKVPFLVFSELKPIAILVVEAHEGESFYVQISFRIRLNFKLVSVHYRC